MRLARTAAFVLMTLVLPPAPGRAQPPTRALSLGLTGAVNLATVGGDDAAGAESKAGLAIGAFLRKPMGDNWAFQGEVQYSLKGAKVSDNGLGGKLNLAYIELPLLFRAFAGGGSSTRPFVEFGPSLALKTGCTVSVQGGSVTGSVSCSEFGEVKAFDAGLAGGGGFEFPVGTNTLALGVRYTHGLVDIGDGASVQNRNLQFLLGIRF